MREILEPGGSQQPKSQLLYPVLKLEGSRRIFYCLLQFVQGLPYGTNIRHHIVGDVGKENKLAVQNRKIVNK